MKLLTLNFLTCAVKTCKPLPAAFPLHVRDAELEGVELEFNPLFLRNILSRIEWPAMRAVLHEVGLTLPEGIPGTEEVKAAHVGEAPPEAMEGVEAEGAVSAADEGKTEMEGLQKVQIPQHKHEEEVVPEETLRKLHEILMETQITGGKLVCGNCEHEYAIKEGIPNFLLPPHLV